MKIISNSIWPSILAGLLCSFFVWLWNQLYNINAKSGVRESIERVKVYLDSFRVKNGDVSFNGKNLSEYLSKTTFSIYYDSGYGKGYSFDIWYINTVRTDYVLIDSIGTQGFKSNRNRGSKYYKS